MTELFTTVQNSSDEELKPCPFCGWDVRIERLPTGFVTIEHPDDVECILNAMDSMWWGDTERFIKEWNKRASE